MDIILINKRNIKVSLSKDELELFGLYAQSLEWQDLKTRLLLGKILDIAHERFGFDRCDSKLTVSVFPSADGGCELFVTKKSPVTKATYDKKHGVICFAKDTEELFCLCEKLKEADFSGASSLYLGEKGELVMICENKKAFPSYMKESDIKKKNCDLTFLSEHGRTYDATEDALAYIGEHMTLLVQNEAMDRIIGTF